MSSLQYVCALIAVYVALVRSLRWRRYNALHAKFAGRSLESITVEEAQEIMHLNSMWDLPFINLYALSFAMFKTYAIPRVSVILSNTKELRSKELISKRQADTEILIATFMACPVNGYYAPNSEYNKVATEKVAKSSQKNDDADLKSADPRSMIAVARMNWLHSRYKIRNDDYLYTLGLFVFEPIRWAEMYGWRTLSELECHALFVFWHEIGRRMGIQGIPDTAKELEAWCLEHEVNEMKPAATNRELAGYTTEELLRSVPEFLGLKILARKIVVCLLEERVRVSMLQPAQPRALHLLVWLFMQSLTFTQGWLLLPRMKPWCLVPFVATETQPVEGGSKPRMHPTKFQARPWYKPTPTSPLLHFFNRLALAVGIVEELPAKELKSDGYRLEELGPIPAEHSGHKEVFQSAEELLGCPVVGHWGLDGGMSVQSYNVVSGEVSLI